jgi:hypothetical protein
MRHDGAMTRRLGAPALLASRRMTTGVAVLSVVLMPKPALPRSQ